MEDFIKSTSRKVGLQWSSTYLGPSLPLLNTYVKPSNSIFGWVWTFKFNEMQVKIWSQQVHRRGPGPQAPDSHVLTKNCFIERFKAPSSVELKQSSRKCNFGIFDVCVRIPYPNFISYTTTNTVLKKFFIAYLYVWIWSYGNI